MFFRSLKIFVILFLLIASSVNSQRRDLLPIKPDPNTINVKIFRAINNSQCWLLNKIVPFSSESMTPIAIVTPITMYLVSRNNNNYHENSSVLLALSEGLTYGITSGIKGIVRRPRPFIALSDVKGDKCYYPSDICSSFPSGHTSTSFSLATSLTLRYPDKPVLITGLYLYSTVVSLGRIYLGVHYPTDVLAGMLIGSGIATAVHAFRKEIIDTKNCLLGEKGREDVNQKSISTTLIFSSFIATDILNYFLGQTKSKILNSGNVGFDLRGYDNRIKVHYNF
jgi:membrane-associated phospholipid phosphatase